MILPRERNSRLITIRRGGTLTDSDHRLLALWAAACAEHVLHLCESVQPSDPRPRIALFATGAGIFLQGLALQFPANSKTRCILDLVGSVLLMIGALFGMIGAGSVFLGAAEATAKSKAAATL